ncbi:hypothetical protein TREES_T100018443 [Tupaia chinensis]|uniref:Uncharacterized protein n=1 Tax=Tupaia chinensis TaxID=246437 RepID=L9L2N2_TUPCH|nr:hypothetical protein TREES_T100018443 [Tupaia chinensis]
MFQPTQAYNPRIGLRGKPEELQELHCVSHLECPFITCIGLLIVTLGMVVSIQDSPHHLAFSMGMTMITTGSVLVVVSGVIVLCRANQNLLRNMRRRLLVERWRGGASDSTEHLVVDSTLL